MVYSITLLRRVGAYISRGTCSHSLKRGDYMACYHPNMILMNTNSKIHTGKYQLLKYVNSHGQNFKGYEWYDQQNKIFYEQDQTYEWVKVPCKQCAGCQETYSKQWAMRCMAEAKEHKYNYFLTLTYDDNHIPREDTVKSPIDGKEYYLENPESGQLKPEDMEQFIKNIRQTWKREYDHTGIRFYMCGEYGGKTERPHYHIILFNFPIPLEELKIYKTTQHNDILWNCEKIEKIWGKGYVVIAEVNWDTCAYVARYVQKKWGNRWNAQSYYERGLTPEYVRMSRMPGIGLKYYEKNLYDIYINDEIITKAHKGKTAAIRPPAYYDRKFGEDYPEHLEKIKARRKAIATEMNRNKNNLTSLTEAERLQNEEYDKRKKMATLRRDMSL